MLQTHAARFPRTYCRQCLLKLNYLKKTNYARWKLDCCTYSCCILVLFFFSGMSVCLCIDVNYYFSEYNPQLSVNDSSCSAGTSFLHG